MREHVDIELNKYPWECECCGNGSHVRISWVVDGVKTIYSRNDQFGGSLGDDELEFEYCEEYAEEFCEGIKAGLISAGYSAEVVKC